MVGPLLKVLVRMHKQRIIHRDIKPENIFLISTKRFKLGDLGLAIQASTELPFTRSGTLDYMAPEVCLAHLAWSCACVLAALSTMMCFSQQLGIP